MPLPLSVAVALTLRLPLRLLFKAARIDRQAGCRSIYRSGCLVIIGGLNKIHRGYGAVKSTDGVPYSGIIKAAQNINPMAPTFARIIIHPFPHHATDEAVTGNNLTGGGPVIWYAGRFGGSGNKGTVYRIVVSKDIKSV